MANNASYIRLGNKAFNSGCYAEAIEHYLRAIETSAYFEKILSHNIKVGKKRLSEEVSSNNLKPTQTDHETSGVTIDEEIPEIIFDAEFYLEQYPDGIGSSYDPQDHYYQFGEAEGKWPNPYFDPQYYLKAHNDVRAIGISPFRHYKEHGYKEVRKIREAQQNIIHESKRRGTFVLVTHDTDVGGAQHLLTLLAKWLGNRTRFSVQLIAINGGNLRHKFEEVAPLIVLSEHSEDSRKKIMNKWLSPDAVGAFVNSIASAEVLHYLPSELPIIAFIHELPQILDLYPDHVELIRNHALRVIGGGPDVSRSLVSKYGLDSDKVYSSVSFIEALAQEENTEDRRRVARLALNCSNGQFIVIGCGVLHWRKSPDKFIEVAERVIASGIDAQFIWLGGGPDKAKCDALVAAKGLQDKVFFTGYEPQVAQKIAAGDLFLLSSQEDPFPLVALYAAQAGMPIVCFQQAGGIESFVAEGSGVATPFMDVDAMAEAVITYAKDPAEREVAGRIGQLQVEKRHTIDVAGPLLLNHLREAAHLAPEVSVVLPNFNYEAYLPERLESIASQSFQDFEVILLDDASTDGSAQLLKDFGQKRPGSQVVINNENSGSPFAQWMLGMEKARANVIWLAEADDRCTPDFLETMLPFFDDRNFRLASCASQPITSEGKVIGDYRQLYLDRITPNRWNKDFIATDHEEANAGLGIANSIPNASAVLIRKFTPEPEFLQELTSMRLCGDWYFYVRAMRGGLIGYSARVMNDHRRHGNTVTHQLEGSFQYFDELAKVRNYLGRTYAQVLPVRTRIAEFLQQDITRFNVQDSNALPQVPPAIKALPSLLVVTPDLSPGGGQVFAISVANDWMRRGGRVILLNVGNQPSHPAMMTKIPPEVTLLEASDPGADLGTIIQRFDINAIHSCIWWADRWVDDNRQALPADMPWVITMHGCHETILQEPGIDSSFPERMERMIARASWVYTADKNLSVFDTLGHPSRLVKIPNGVAEVPPATPLDKTALGLRADAVVLCLTSRAIRSKGWAEAMRLTDRLNREGHVVDLILLGEGPDFNALHAGKPDNVHFLGQVPNPQAYFELADIGLLPSYFVGESLPLVLLEMMAKYLPLVASDIGEIPWIIGTGNDAAGLIVPRTATGIDEDAFHVAVLKLLDPALRHHMARNSHARYEQDFTLQGMVDKYAMLYDVI